MTKQKITHKIVEKKDFKNMILNGFFLNLLFGSLVIIILTGIYIITTPIIPDSSHIKEIWLVLITIIGTLIIITINYLAYKDGLYESHEKVVEHKIIER